MAELCVLVNGYYTVETNVVCATITLIRDNGVNIVVDPGTVPDQQIIISALAREYLTLDDIGYVFITHSHLDHYRNIGMFARAKSLDYWGLWDGHSYIYNTMSRNFSNDIFIQMTPGHSYDNITLFVKTTAGIYAVCGDVFWDKNGPKIDTLAQDNDRLLKSREIILKKADYIVPGHGDVFASKDISILL
ncbi:MAG: MBL fold metallo-hydrolase [Candidatus Auribacterota bacterium]|nr:MBL fold metallo-hydrolase [Candidatus Auribacterota bacterium]